MVLSCEVSCWRFFFFALLTGGLLTRGIGEVYNNICVQVAAPAVREGERAWTSVSTVSLG